jgi:hypothetical protein
LAEERREGRTDGNVNMEERERGEKYRTSVPLSSTNSCGGRKPTHLENKLGRNGPRKRRRINHIPHPKLRFQIVVQILQELSRLDVVADLDELDAELEWRSADFVESGGEFDDDVCGRGRAEEGGSEECGERIGGREGRERSGEKTFSREN